MYIYVLKSTEQSDADMVVSGFYICLQKIIRQKNLPATMKVWYSEWSLFSLNCHHEMSNALSQTEVCYCKILHSCDSQEYVFKRLWDV